MIKLKYIDTSTAEKNIIQLLKKNETYFLNGAWGSGKTVFLNNISKKLPPIKLVELNLWKIKDERSVIEIAFSKLYRCLYWTIKFVVVLAAVISILMTPLINLGLSQLFPKFIVVAGTISLIVTVWQFLKYKSDDFYRFIFRNCSIKNKVLVVDDFDRISSQKQEELYSLFNILKGRLPIVFVGDFTKINHSEGDYLRKIIDKRLELPIVLHPKNIWNNYFNELSQQLETSLSTEFQDIFIAEKRNLRDQKQFNELVNQEFFQHKKLHHVQVEQQLSLIYLYLFYPEKYQFLRDDGTLEHSNEYQDYLQEKEKQTLFVGSEPKKTIEDTFKLLLSSNNKYPASFTQSRETYLLYETVSNLSTKKAKHILQDNDQLETMLLGEGDYFNDFYQFVTFSYSGFNEEKEQLVNLSLQLIKENHTSKLIEYIITQKTHEIMPPKVFLGGSNGVMSWEIPDEWGGKNEDTIEEILFSEWEKILIDYQFDLSQKLYFFEKYLRISFNKLGLKYPDLDLDSNDYHYGKRKDFYLLTYLSIKDLWFNLDDWDENIWSNMKRLSNTEYLSVLTASNILESGKSFFNFDEIPKNKTYIVYTKVQHPDNPRKLFDFADTIKNHIEPRLTALTKEGFQFDYRVKKYGN
ncbi:P-loop NTPase fold protein [Enterococcus faecium]|uniref:P-loop NTPase fold protein n=1 Tax=Enterococcus TaxID=1350 RepID=UPI000A338B90|nr:P-loop NTPase fold protein [Enterococcus faecium]OTN78278.1 hypothetical protein A5826_002130 [Enterococcus faecium]